MIEADGAYELAQREIAEAARAETSELVFFGSEFKALTQLPPEIGDLKRLQELSLMRTQISNLTPLTGLTGLQSLWLRDTQISDLAPLAGMTGLCDLELAKTGVADLRPLAGLQELGTIGFPGLSFADTPATKRDTRLAELAQIEDTAERARKTLTYLHSLPPWPEPYTPEATPDRSPPQPIGGNPQEALPPLTLEAILTAQTPLGWQFSPDHGTMVLYVEDQPLNAFQEQFARMTAERLAAMLDQLGNADFGIRGALRDEAKRFDSILHDESRSLAVKSLELWGSLVALGSLLDANDEARRNGQDPLDLMAPQQRASLQTLLQVAGNLVRSFPDVQTLDESAGGFLRKEVTLECVSQLIETAISTHFVDFQSAALMQHMKDVAHSPGKQGDKAASASTRGAANMALTAAMIVGTPFAVVGAGIVNGAAEQVGSEIAVEYELGQRAIQFIETGQGHLEPFIDNLPPDEAAQLRSTLGDALEKIAGQNKDAQ